MEIKIEGRAGNKKKKTNETPNGDKNLQLTQQRIDGRKKEEMEKEKKIVQFGCFFIT